MNKIDIIQAFIHGELDERKVILGGATKRNYFAGLTYSEEQMRPVLYHQKGAEFNILYYAVKLELDDRVIIAVDEDIIPATLYEIIKEEVRHIDMPVNDVSQGFIKEVIS